MQRGPKREHSAGRNSGIGRHAAVERRSPAVTSEDVAEIGACLSTFAVPGSGNERRLVEKGRGAGKDRMADQRATLAAAVAVRRLARAERPRERASKRTN